MDKDSFNNQINVINSNDTHNKRDLLVLLYMGGANSLDDVESFIYNLLSDRELIDMKIGNFQYTLAKFIAKRRSKRSRANYELIGGKSPILDFSLSISARLSKLYQQTHNVELETKIGMCYSSPFIQEMYDDLIKSSEHFGKVYVVTLYPQYSKTTSGVCFNRFQKLINRKPFIFNSIKYIYSYTQDKQYGAMLASRIEKTIKENYINASECHIMFSAHSLPKREIEENGDIYVEELNRSISLAMNSLPTELSKIPYSLSYQSAARFGGWLKPTIDEDIKEITKRSKNNGQEIKNVLVIPISFTIDNIETLWEIDIDFIPKAKEKYNLNIYSVPLFNDDSDFIDFLHNKLK